MDLRGLKIRRLLVLFVAAILAVTVVAPANAGDVKYKAESVCKHYKGKDNREVCYSVYYQVEGKWSTAYAIRLNGDVRRVKNATLIYDGMPYNLGKLTRGVTSFRTFRHLTPSRIVVKGKHVFNKRAKHHMRIYVGTATFW